jgi:hypothetical protein
MRCLACRTAAHKAPRPRGVIHLEAAPRRRKVGNHGGGSVRANNQVLERNRSTRVLLGPQWPSDGIFTNSEANTTSLEYRVPYRRASAIFRLEHRIDDSRGPQGGFFRGGELAPGGSRTDTHSKSLNPRSAVGVRLTLSTMIPIQAPNRNRVSVPWGISQRLTALQSSAMENGLALINFNFRRPASKKSATGLSVLCTRT